VYELIGGYDRPKYFTPLLTFFSGFQQKKRPHEAVRGTMDEVLACDCWKIFRLFFFLGGIAKDALSV